MCVVPAGGGSSLRGAGLFLQQPGCDRPGEGDGCLVRVLVASSRLQLTGRFGSADLLLLRELAGFWGVFGRAAAETRTEEK